MVVDSVELKILSLPCTSTQRHVILHICPRWHMMALNGRVCNTRDPSCVAQLVHDQGAGEGAFLKPCDAALCPRTNCCNRARALVVDFRACARRIDDHWYKRSSTKCLTSIVILNSGQLSMCVAEARDFPTSAASQPDTRTTQMRTWTT